MSSAQEFPRTFKIPRKPVPVAKHAQYDNQDGDLTILPDWRTRAFSPASLTSVPLHLETSLVAPKCREHSTTARTLNKTPTGTEAGEWSTADIKRKQSTSALLRYAYLSVYRRLFSIVFAANLVAFICVLVPAKSLSSLLSISINASAANFVVSILARQEYVINALFTICCSVPRSAPLRLRCTAAEIFHYGGIHSGCGIAAIVWYALFTAMTTHRYAISDPRALKHADIVVLTYIMLVVLVAIPTAAYPTLRSKQHNAFEYTHRFLGWTAIVIFWILLTVMSNRVRGTQSLGVYLLSLPAFWFLLVSTVSIILPWLRLRRITIDPEYLSSHAVRLHFDYTNPGMGTAIRLARHPLGEYHCFATLPDPRQNVGNFSCIVSSAGDWTNWCISSQPTKLWKRGIPFFGVVHVARLFHRVIVVATGSGIGPAYSLIVSDQCPPCRVVWQTRSPQKTYERELYDKVMSKDPAAVIIDTDNEGRKDMLDLVYNMAKEFGSEAVICISNPKVTRSLVFRLRAMGVAAYGPIWDS